MNLPKRKSNRLKYYDYSSNGAYFVTMCVKKRMNLLGKIVGDGVYDVPRTDLTKFGKILEKHIEVMDNKYEYIVIDKYIIMPNHVHLLIQIYRDDNGAFGTSQAPSPTNEIIPKFVSLLKRYCNREYGRNIWQRSYHDHIVRDEKDYQKIWKYIDINPLKWKEDCFYNE